METSGRILMISGGALAVLVAGLVSLLLARQPATTTLLPNATVGAASVQPAMAPVLIATRHIPRGAVVRAADVGRLFKLVYEPAGVVTAQTTFSDPAQLSALLDVVPRRTIETIAPGEQIAAPLFSGMAVPGQSDNSLAARLARGFDGETLSIPIAGDAVDGAIKVNDRVDVLYSMPVGRGANAAQQYTGTLIQGATVVATNPLSTTYTLALHPSDAVRLAHAKDAGWSLHLVLRSIFDAVANVGERR